MKQQPDYVIIGKIGSTYGIKGWVKVFSYTQEIANILRLKPWYIEGSSGWIEADLQEGRSHGSGVIAKLAGYDTPEKARLLTGKKIAILRSQLPRLKKNEYYWHDLEGLTVIDQHDQILGKVSYLIETGANDVVVVKGKKEYAIPYLSSVITRVDLDKKELHVDWE